MRVYVNSQDIRKGYKSLNKCHFIGCTCPVARALKRKLGCKVTVTGTWCLFGGKKYNLGLSAKRLVDDFDNKRNVKPQHISISDTPLTKDYCSF